MPLIKCPSGLEFNARLMTVDELVEFGTAAYLNEADGGLGRVLQRIWQDVVDPGPYSFLQNGGQPNWDKMLTGDILAAVIQARIASRGPDYEFGFRCESCGRQQKDDVAVDLSKLEMKELPKESFDILLNRAASSTHKLPNGDEVTFTLALNGLHKELLAIKKRYRIRLQDQKDPRAAIALKPQIHDRLVVQVTWVKSLGEKSRDGLSRLAWASALELPVFEDLKKAMEDADCGVETGVTDAQCEHEPSCDWIQRDLNLPLGGGFFTPKRKPKTKAPKTEETPEDSPPAAPAMAMTPPTETKSPSLIPSAPVPERLANAS